MRAVIQGDRIRIKPVPKEEGWMLWILLKKPLLEGNKPLVYSEIVKGRKFYDLPCELDNVISVMIAPK